MSSECRGDSAAQAAPVFTVYPVPGGNGGNVNYGFLQSNPHAPPPKYEDVISGMSGAPVLPAQRAGTYDMQEQQGVIFVAPIYKPSGIQRSLAIIFSVLFIMAFVSVLIKILTVSSNI